MRFVRKILVLAAVVVAVATVHSEGVDPSLDSGRHFEPFILTLKPSLQMSPLPGWMPAPAVVHSETATIEVPVPALWAAPFAEIFAITVVFDDHGDGGPAVEWRSQDGTTTTLSQGLGEWGAALGLNARTLVLPQELTRQGGVLLISYYAKFENFLSLAVRPARKNPLAVLGAASDPVLVDEAMRVFDRSEVDGRRNPPVGGDIRRGAIVEAELSAPVEQMDGEIEFVVPVEGPVEGALVKLDVLGLDPEATIEVEINSRPIGTIGFSPFRLDDPALVPDSLGRLVVAGWRSGWAFIPADTWHSGDNALILRLQRSAAETDRQVFIRNADLHLRFGAEVNSEGKAAPEPDFSLPDPLLPNPIDPPLPEIVTGAR